MFDYRNNIKKILNNTSADDKSLQNSLNAIKAIINIGDYLKVLANGVVMLQPIIALAITFPLDLKKQIFLASLYNLVKFTSPAFIFGIVFMIIMTNKTTNPFN